MDYRTFHKDRVSAPEEKKYYCRSCGACMTWEENYNNETCVDCVKQGRTEEVVQDGAHLEARAGDAGETSEGTANTPEIAPSRPFSVSLLIMVFMFPVAILVNVTLFLWDIFEYAFMPEDVRKEIEANESY